MDKLKHRHTNECYSTPYLYCLVANLLVLIIPSQSKGGQLDTTVFKCCLDKK